jgi:transmembrane sensor
VAAVVAGWWLVTTLAPSAEVYATRVGDQKSIALSDGSVLDLNTESRARVQFSAGGRDVLLLEGEALFTVAHDANRPFRVHSGDVVVQAIGTRFNVYRTGETTKVAVVEGVVQLSAGSGSGEESRGGARLAAGEEAQVAHGRIVKTPTPDIHRAVAWKARQLVFQGDRVEDVVREFNRYSARPIRVEGETIRARRMSGVFDANDPSPLIQFLSRNPDVEVVRSEKEVLIRPRG